MRILNRLLNLLKLPSSVVREKLAADRLNRAITFLRQGREGVARWNALKKSGALNPLPLAGNRDDIAASLGRAFENGTDMGDGVYTVNLGDYLEKPAGGWSQALRIVNTIEADGAGPDLPCLDLKNLDLTGVDFSFCNLVQSDFSGSTLDGANFTKANLTLTRFVGSRAHSALFQTAYLSSADLSDADLYHASFDQANLRDCYLRNANLWGADLSLARLLRADLLNATVERAIVMDIQVQELLNPPKPPTVLFLAPGRAQLRQEDVRHVFHTGWKTRLAAKNIFISYRRSDTADTAERLFSMLSSVLGEDRVFLDRRSIPSGADDFTSEIEEAIRHTTLFLLLIGDGWDTSRLYSDTDHVRREIERAFLVGASILPVLIGTGGMPAPDEMPVSIQPLSRIQAAGPVALGDGRDNVNVVVETVCRMMAL